MPCWPLSRRTARRRGAASPRPKTLRCPTSGRRPTCCRWVQGGSGGGAAGESRAARLACTWSHASAGCQQQPRMREQPPPVPSLPAKRRPPCYRSSPPAELPVRKGAAGQAGLRHGHLCGSRLCRQGALHGRGGGGGGSGRVAQVGQRRSSAGSCDAVDAWLLPTAHASSRAASIRHPPACVPTNQAPAQFPKTFYETNFGGVINIDGVISGGYPAAG